MVKHAVTFYDIFILLLSAILNELNMILLDGLFYCGLPYLQQILPLAGTVENKWSFSKYQKWIDRCFVRYMNETYLLIWFTQQNVFLSCVTRNCILTLMCLTFRVLVVYGCQHFWIYWPFTPYVRVLSCVRTSVGRDQHTCSIRSGSKLVTSWSEITQ